MLPSLIKIFKTVAVADKYKLLDAELVNKSAMKCGYIVHPAACTSDVVEFIESQTINPNSTFYKEWQDVISRDEWEMRVMQLIHYATTYGTDYQSPTFTMNPDPADIDFSKYTVLLPCTDRQLFDRIATMVSSPVALSTELINDLIEQLRQYREQYGWEIDMEKVNNREAQVRLCDIYGQLPEESLTFLRYIVYKTSGKTLIIKDERSIEEISQNSEAVLNIFLNLSQRQKEQLASIFYRFKPLFLALRKGFKELNTDNGRPAASVINRIRRMARKFHRPAKTGVLESILNPAYSMSEIQDAVCREVSNFKLVKLINYLNSKNSESRFSVYIIRNGKLFIKPNTKSLPKSETNIENLIKIITDELVYRLGKKSIKEDGSHKMIKFPDNISLALPVSERQFVGNTPFGTEYALMRNNLIGIYWKNEWGTHDFDLWLTSRDGLRLGWSADHKNEDLLFSGDMTNADPEATEVFYGKGNSWPDSIISVVRYNGIQGSKFRLFFASDEIDQLPTGYMVRPDSILFQEDIISDLPKTTIGVISDRKLYFGSLGSGKARVPDDKKEIDLCEALTERFSRYAKLKPLLMAAGFEPHSESSGKSADIDLTELNKDTLIRLID
ncbi:MAG: hypothetical protein NC127_09450 [Muribaculum sp.]|nr:hypothetical protein [Muribaculum sp.]